MEEYLKCYLRETVNNPEKIDSYDKGYIKIIDTKRIKQSYIEYKLKVLTKDILYAICDSRYGYFIEKEKDGFLLGVLLPLNKNSIKKYEYDRAENAFALYQSIYPNAARRLRLL